jgi:hypothetical protein
MIKNTLWTKFLLFDSLLLSLTGLLFAFDLPVLFPDIQAEILNLYFNITYSTPVPNYISFIFGISGAVMFGWGMMAVYLSYTLLKEDNKVIWNSLLVGSTSWFIVDCFISIYTTAYLNIIVNIAFYTLFLIPILMNFKHQN